ncbi:hypothetical protein BaRGS_00024874 [Batillaria attramentaria]|uniref:Tctex1 domain-containing protein 2 n=1 Tax=Batillaria attramentaria TaxID=370345 RepID=A0ABD0KA19_9CAEN
MGEEGSEQTQQQAAPANQQERDGNTYVIRPNFQHKFRPVMVKEMIHMVLTDQLAGKTYDPESTTEWTKNISDTIKSKLKDMGYDRYKFIVQVIIAEQRGQGTKMACRCFWDSDTDSYAQDLYMNDSLVCVAAAYGVFHY